MRNLNTLPKYFFILLALLLISGCDAIQDVILTESPIEMDTTPLRVTMIYPSDCVGSAAYCDAFHIGVKTAETELGITLTEVNGMENDPVATEMLIRDGSTKFGPCFDSRLSDGRCTCSCSTRIS